VPTPRPSRCSVHLLTVGALLLPAGASAAPHIDVDIPGLVPTADQIDLVDIGGTDRPLAVVPRSASDTIATDQRPQQLGAKVLYINFDGIDLNACGNNNPHQNCSTIFGGTVLPYTGDIGMRASIIQTVRNRVEDFGITVTNERPSSGDYDMEVVGDWQGQNPSFAGIAPGGDCWDNGGGEVSFTLEASGSTDGMAEIILQELAHTWGLDHVDSVQDLLYPTTEGQNKTFRDECLQVVSDVDLSPAQGFCSHHQEACGTMSQQNSYQEMLMIFGPSVPDTQAPLIQVLSPSHGDILDGSDFDLEIGIEDDQRPAVIVTRITIDSEVLPEPIETSGAFVGPNELSFPISGLPNGDYDIVVEGEDESDNPASDTITIRIQGSEVPPAGDDDDDDDDAEDDGGNVDDGGSGDDQGQGGDDDDDDDDDDDAETGDTEGAGADGGGGDSGGCAVHTPGLPRGPAALGLVLLLGVIARRRAA